MKRAFVLLSVLASLVSPQCVLAADAIPADARKAIDTANNNWVPALEKGDAATAYAPFAPDAVFVGTDGSVKTGTADAVSGFEKRFRDGLRITDGKVVSYGAEMINGQILEWGSSLLTASIKDKPPRTAGGYYVVIWSKGTDGVWRITRDISLAP